MAMLLYSIVIPTYNRIAYIDETIRSAIEFISNSACRAEIIIVDDASEDGTCEHIEKVWKSVIEKRVIRLFRSENNSGVAGARNRGVLQSHGQWIVFLDSDDLLIPEYAQRMTQSLKQSDRYPIVFFRCMTLETQRLIGPRIDQPYDLSVKELLNTGTPGECLPAIKTRCMLNVPYDEALNGCEGITYAEIIDRYGCARVVPLIVRKYRTENRDRLSVGKRFQARKSDIRAYHVKVLFKYAKHLRIKTIIGTVLKIVWYSLDMMIGTVQQRTKGTFKI